MHSYQFYILPEKISEGKFSLTGGEFRHCCRVLRKTVGSAIDVFDGNGRRWSARLESITKNSAECRVIEEYPLQARLKPEIILGIGLLKNNLLDEIVINATALGVAKIIPLRAVHAIKFNVNRERLTKLALSALKQSGIAYIPAISEAMSLSDWFDLISQTSCKLIAEQHSSVSLHRIEALQSADQIAVMIGPEGGFDETEIRPAEQAGFIKVNIFPYRLRTELAAVTALSAIRTLTAKYNEAKHGN